MSSVVMRFNDVFTSFKQDTQQVPEFPGLFEEIFVANCTVLTKAEMFKEVVVVLRLVTVVGPTNVFPRLLFFNQPLFHSCYIGTTLL